MTFSLRHTANLLEVLAGRPAPIYVQLAVSNTCSLRCRMCNVVEARRGEPELDVTQLARLADVLRKMRVGFLVLTGGEPLQRRDIVDVVQAVSKRGITVRLQSNGMLFERPLLEQLRDAGLAGITISLHSLSPAMMDELTNVPGALGRVLEALCMYSEVFPTRRYVGGINTVVSRANLREVPRLIRFASALGMAIALIPIHLAPAQAATVQLDGARMALTAADAPAVNEVFAEARALKRKGARVYNSDRFLAACPPFLTTGRVDWTCDSPLLYFSISSSGKLLPCVDLPGRHSLLDDDFLQAWRSGAIVREIQAEVARCPGCMYACYPELSYLLHSKAMFIRRALDFVRLRAPSQPITMERIRRLVDEM